MKMIKLKTGIASIPEDWCEVKMQPTGDEDYVGVIEMRSGDYPHFYFTSDTNHFNEEVRTKVLDAICQEHPWFYDEVVKKQVEAIWEGKTFVNEDQWAQAPTIGFFNVPEDDGINSIFPFGAKIVRGKGVKRKVLLRGNHLEQNIHSADFLLK